MTTIYSTAVVQADGTTNSFAIPFPYLDKTHVHVSVNGAEVDPTTLTFTSYGVVQLAQSPSALAKAVITIQRITPAATPYVVFTSGGLDPKDLNDEAKQLLYVVQEISDLAFSEASLQYIPPVIGTLSVLISQVLQGLADPNNIGYDPLYKVLRNIPPDIPYNPISAGFKGYSLRLRDAVYTYIGNQLGLSPGGMTLFLQQCALYPTTPDPIAVPTMGTVATVVPPTVALMSQIYQGLGDPASAGYDPTNLVLGNIPPLIPYSAVSAGFKGANLVRAGDAVYNFIKTKLSLTQPQMDSFYNLCLSYPVTPL